LRMESDGATAQIWALADNLVIKGNEHITVQAAISKSLYLSGTNVNLRKPGATTVYIQMTPAAAAKINFVATCTSAAIDFLDEVTSGGGANLTISSQTTTVAGQAGGDLILKSGVPGAGGTSGKIQLYAGSDQILSIEDGTVTLEGDYDIIPAVTGKGEVGTASKKFKAMYAELGAFNDVCFYDDNCPICGQKFTINDKLVLQVYDIQQDEGGEMKKTVPVHAACGG
jgi:hypothetical protein